MPTHKVAAQDWELYVTIPAGAEHQVLNIKSIGPMAQATKRANTDDFTTGSVGSHLKTGGEWTLPVSCHYMEDDAGVQDLGQADIVTLSSANGTSALGSFRLLSPGGLELAGDGTVEMSGRGGGALDAPSEFNFTIHCTEEWT